MPSSLEILKRLVEKEVDFVLVGGMASVAHGSSMVTEDLDVCARLDTANASRILQAIGDLDPKWRTNPRHPALTSDPSVLATFNNLYLLTNLGIVDVLGEITGIGSFDEVKRRSIEIQVAGVRCRVMDLSSLIESKRAIGRPKDIHVARELEAIQETCRRGTGLEEPDE